jgi:hypothetical protein
VFLQGGLRFLCNDILAGIQGRLIIVLFRQYDSNSIVLFIKSELQNSYFEYDR